MGLGFQLHVRIRPLKKIGYTLLRFVEDQNVQRTEIPTCISSCKACAVYTAVGSQRRPAGSGQENNSAKRCCDDRTQKRRPLRPRRRRCPYRICGSSRRLCSRLRGSDPQPHNTSRARNRGMESSKLCAPPPCTAHARGRARPQPCLAKRDHGKADRTHLIPTLHASRSITRTIAPPAGVTTRAASSGTS